MEFYVVKDENIKLSNKLTQRDIVFVLDGKAGYIWKGTRAVDLDEATAKRVELLIKDTFVEIEFGLIPSTQILESDDPKTIQIKTELKKRLPKQSVERMIEKSSFIRNIKNKIG